ncbi:MAG: ATP-binding protein, partial [Hyphomicrobium sp.]
LVLGLAALAAFLAWRQASAARRAERSAKSENDALKRSLALSEAIHNADPQVLMLWEHGDALKLVTHGLKGIQGLPEQQAELLRFGQWLEPKSAEMLKLSLDALFLEGRAFTIILKTALGGHLEADGRATGARAVLRMRDVAGYKRDLGHIIDQHLSLARDIRASRAILDALPMPAWLKDQHGRIAWVNSAYTSAVEAQSAAEVIERQIELIETRPRKLIEAAISRRECYRERMHLVIGGERKAHDVVVLSLEDATAGVAIDVAAIESAQGELDRQVAAYDRTLDRVATAVAIFSKEQRLTFFNEAFQKLWELDASWLETGPADGTVLDRLRALGRLPEVVKYPEWKSKALSRYQTGAALDEWWHLPDGRMLHVISELRPDGGLTYLYVDETERIALESSYNALISVQRETLDSLTEAVAVFATDGRLQLHNTAFERIWKLSGRTLAERPHIDEIIHLGRVLYDDDATWQTIHRAVTSFTDKREPIDGQMVRPDASVIDYAATPLPDGATLLTFADVTDETRYQRALEERNEALIVADRLKNQFIGHVSYELRTPLTNIIGFSELLESPIFGTLNPKQREYLGDISASSKTLLAIIDDILDLATIDAGSLELKLGKVDIRGVIDSAVRGVAERAARDGLTLDIAIADDARELDADEERLRQVLYNLLSNAVGFSHAGATIKLSCWRDDGHVIFMVEDEGVGIPLDQQAHVFDRFESRSQGSNHRGAGLGLSIVKSLVELHGGEAALVSEPGHGTRVAVRFPERATVARSIPPMPAGASLRHDDAA